MQRLNFSVDINAAKEKVWDILWDDETYQKWTAAFSEGSYAKTDWDEGSKVLFLSKEGDGMYSTIARKIPNEFMSFKHMGVVKEGKEQPLDDETRKWSGAMENYALKETGGLTTLLVEMDATDDFADYFKETFPKALDKVKQLAEGE